MKVRIVFSSEIVIDGENIDQVREKWEDLCIYSTEATECGVEFAEVIAVENAETNEDMSDEWCESAVL